MDFIMTSTVKSSTLHRNNAVFREAALADMQTIWMTGLDLIENQMHNYNNTCIMEATRGTYGYR